jgi:hypothetical protein
MQMQKDGFLLLWRGTYLEWKMPPEAKMSL